MSVKVKKTEKATKDQPKAAPQSRVKPEVPDDSKHPLQHPLLALREEVDHLFDNFFSGFALGPFGEFSRDGLPAMTREPFRRIEDAFAGLSPSLGKLSIKADVCETDDAFRIEAEIPGLTEDDLDISVTDGQLTIRGEKKEETKEDREDYHLTERHFGSVKRTFPVPDTVDLAKAEANFKNGVLRITLPKKALVKSKAKKIPIAGG